jgi:predicted dehydrogenase/nucleoside-diphosphate-sugar epimerase
MEPKRERELRVAIIGCGAVVERLHLPVLLGMSSVTVAVLVDTDSRRLELLSRVVPEAITQTSIDDVEKLADIAIIALPHHLHVSVGTVLLNKGMHVFMEKPLATRLSDAKLLIDAAERNRVVLAVGQLRRFYETSRYVKEVLSGGWLGRIVNFDVREGGEYGWPAASASLFQRAADGGVLFDTGAHTLDAVVAWLGNARHVEYSQDSRGGVEANCLVELEMESGAKGTVELSRNRNLRNTFVINGERGSLEVGLGPRGPVSLRADGLRVSGLPEDGLSQSGDFMSIARRQLAAYVDAVRGNSDDIVKGDAVLGAMEIFDECRRNPRRIEYGWEKFESDIDWTLFEGTQVLVLGATGFLGHRLVEALMQCANARVRALVRDYSRLSNLARYEVDIVHGDISNSEALSEALHGCDFVFNCTYGKGDRAEQYRVNVTAVENLIKAAADAGVKRVVHVSTVAVYGDAGGEPIRESNRARAHKRDTYAHTKGLGENVALEQGRRHGLEVAIIQPTVVYGPWAPVWTVGQLRLMKQARVGLVDQGRGICNAVYVDDVVAGMLAAAIRNEASGEKFLISGPSPVTWAEFYGAYEMSLGSNSIELLTSQSLADARKKMRKEASTMFQLRRLLKDEYSGRPALIELPPVAALRNFIRAVMPRSAIERMKDKVINVQAPVRNVIKTPEKWLYLPAKAQEEFFSSKSTVDTAKARKLLDFQPRFTLERGMRQVDAWAKWANIC